MQVVASEGPRARPAWRGDGEVSRPEEAPTRLAMGEEAVRLKNIVVVLSQPPIQRLLFPFWLFHQAGPHLVVLIVIIIALILLIFRYIYLPYTCRFLCTVPYCT